MKVTDEIFNSENNDNVSNKEEKRIKGTNTDFDYLRYCKPPIDQIMNTHNPFPFDNYVLNPSKAQISSTDSISDKKPTTGLGSRITQFRKEIFNPMSFTLRKEKKKGEEGSPKVRVEDECVSPKEEKKEKERKEIENEEREGMEQPEDGPKEQPKEGPKERPKEGGKEGPKEESEEEGREDKQIASDASIDEYFHSFNNQEKLDTWGNSVKYKRWVVTLFSYKKEDIINWFEADRYIINQACACTDITPSHSTPHIHIAVSFFCNVTFNQWKK